MVPLVQASPRAAEKLPIQLACVCRALPAVLCILLLYMYCGLETNIGLIKALCLVFTLGDAPICFSLCTFALTYTEVPKAGLLWRVIVTVTATCTLRLAVVFSVWLHEAAHLIAATLLGSTDVNTCANITGNTSWRVWLACLNPLQGFPHSFQPHVVVLPKSLAESSISSSQVTEAELMMQQQQQQQHQRSMTHAAGWVFSCASALWLQYQVSLPVGPQHNQGWHGLLLPPIATGFWVTAAAAVSSDLLGFQFAVTGVEGQHRFCCGNFGIMLADSCNHSVDIVKGSKSLGRAKAVRVRVASSRRGDLATNICTALTRKLRWQRMLSWHAAQAAQHVPLVCAGHCRFATSSIPTAVESHPHQWTPSKTVTVWLPTDSQKPTIAREPSPTHTPTVTPTPTSNPAFILTHGSGDSWQPEPTPTLNPASPPTPTTTSWQLDPISTPHGVFVTHNGDFESYELFGQTKKTADMMAWLAAVLHVRTPASCDSVAIAGLIELLRTQGLWSQSLRLAHQQCTSGVLPEKGGGRGGGGDGGEGGGGVDIETGNMTACYHPTPFQLQGLATLAERTLKQVVSRLTAHGNEQRHSRGSNTPAPDSSLNPLSTPTSTPTPTPSSGSMQGQMCAALGGAEGMAAMAEAMQVAFCKHAQKAAQSEPWLKWITANDRWFSFCSFALLNFVQNDLFWAVRQFLDHAHGSFGLAVVSEVDPGCLVLAAQKQPMTLTFAPHNGLVLYSSEAQATLQPLPPFSKPLQPPSKHAKMHHLGLGTANSREISPPTYRVDMNDTAGEVIILKYQPVAASQATTSAVSTTLVKTADLTSTCSGEELQAAAVNADANASTIWPVFEGQTGAKRDVEDSAHYSRGNAGSRKASCKGGATAQHPCSYSEPGLALHMAMYSVADRSFASKQEFVEGRRLISMQGNAYVPMQSRVALQISKAWTHQAEQDLAEIPAVLQALTDSWQDPESFNFQSASELAKMLKAGVLRTTESPAWTARYTPSHTQAVDLILVAVEASLWTAQQFAQDLMAVIPSLQVVVISSNKLIAMLELAPAEHLTASQMSTARLGLKLDRQRTCVVCISHSGQTFPTIQAARVLSSHLPGRVFVMSGSIDTKISLAVGQSTWKGAPFAGRIFITHAGWRQTEPASLTAVATHHCFTHLLTHLVGHMLDAQESDHRSTEVLLSRADLKDLKAAQAGCLEQALPSLVGWDHSMQAVKSDIHKALVKQGRQWGVHVLEGAWAWLLAAIYIAATVISGHPPFISIANATGVDGMRWVGHVVDSLLYMFSPVLACFLLRLLQGRPLWARLGRRTVLILDIPYVHQLLEAYLSKLFALSYGVASVDVHGADPADHFVHCFTHRVVRGLLMAVGRPDGRLCSHTKTEAWVLLGLQQAKAIRSLGCAAEAVTVGHNPYCKGSAMDHSIVLPTTHQRFCCEDRSVVSFKESSLQPSRRQADLAACEADSQAVVGGAQEGVDEGLMEGLMESRYASLERLVAMQVMFYHMAARVAAFWPLTFSLDRSQSCLRIATTASPVSAADLKSI